MTDSAADFEMMDKMLCIYTDLTNKYVVIIAERLEAYCIASDYRSYLFQISLCNCETLNVLGLPCFFNVILYIVCVSFVVQLTVITLSNGVQSINGG